MAYLEPYRIPGSGRAWREGRSRMRDKDHPVFDSPQLYDIAAATITKKVEISPSRRKR
jgi:hypothetical protein